MKRVALIDEPELRTEHWNWRRHTCCDGEGWWREYSGRQHKNLLQVDGGCVCKIAWIV